MWSRAHYQFFPLIFAGFGWFILQRIPEVKWLAVPAFSVRVALYSVTSLFLCVVAVKTSSHWIGLISCIASLWTTVWLFGGRQGAETFRGPFFFLALLVPLPLNLDLKLVNELQRVAAWLASGGLDFLGLRHAVSGVAIRTAEKGYMVEEACSGVHSLFSAVSALVFWGIFCRYSLVRLFILATQAVFWVLVVNAIRVFLIVYVDSRWQIALDSGWRHDALGFGMYAGILLCAISTDRFLIFLFPKSRRATEAVNTEFLAPLLQPFSDFFTAVLDKPTLNGRSSLIASVFLLVVCFLPLAGLATVSLVRNHTGTAENGLANVALQRIFNEKSVDPEWQGWKLTNFRNESRNSNDPFGVESAIWQFHGHGLDVNLSIDGWFQSWHDLTYCYQGIGWTIQNADNELLGAGDDVIPHTRLSLYKNAPTYASVIFTCFDSTATAINPPDVKGSFFRTVRDRLLTLGNLSDADKAVKPPVFQVQLMIQSDRELQPEELRLIQDMLIHFRTQLVRQISPRP